MEGTASVWVEQFEDDSLTGTGSLARVASTACFGCKLDGKPLKGLQGEGIFSAGLCFEGLLTSAWSLKLGFLCSDVTFSS